ncbi:hypothetical protein LAG90_00965 [Marinilongibacter aquaticus]|uniref:hypothetical protein n=1 Tax=Marinilongibacter aquaticus TaxID=2975157 RepID=UPI0021BD6B67|nr:hypothetical protein [Marinilongibacter aquaticus]UBM59228.1 hypothetical protein LAG90_00965 [Marinilongibacter aquaticus]
MKFGLTQESNLTTEQSSALNDLSLDISRFLEQKSYGKDVEELYIGIICVKPEFEPFFKVRKPKYTKEFFSEKLGVPVSGKSILEIDLKIDYNEVKDFDKNEITNYAASEICQLFGNLNNLPKNIHDFEKNRFVDDIISFLSNKGSVLS